MTEWLDGGRYLPQVPSTCIALTPGGTVHLAAEAVEPSKCPLSYLHNKAESKPQSACPLFLTPPEERQSEKDAPNPNRKTYIYHISILPFLNSYSCSSPLSSSFIPAYLLCFVIPLPPINVHSRSILLLDHQYSLPYRSSPFVKQQSQKHVVREHRPDSPPSSPPSLTVFRHRSRHRPQRCKLASPNPPTPPPPARSSIRSD